MASTSDNLYVTFVDVDRDLLKVWGQRNRIGATYIERQLLQLLPEFNRAHIPNPSEIHKGMFCFAKYTDDNFYRARVISRVQNDSVRVLFVDYGNKDIIKLSNIRIQQGKEVDVLAKMSEQAEEYYLARIASPTIGWTKEIVSEIRRDICYDEFLYNISAQVADQKILEIQFHGEDFSNYLVKKKLASPLPLPVQKQMILSYCSLVSNDGKSEPGCKETQKVNFTPSASPPNLRVSFNIPNEVTMPPNYGKPKTPVSFPRPPPGILYPSPQQMNTFQQIKPDIPKKLYFPTGNHPSGPLPVTTSPPHTVNPVLNPLMNNQFNPMPLMKENANPFNCNSNIIQLLAQQVKQYIAEDNAKTEAKTEENPHHYLNSVLEVGSTYNVITSYIDDGPWSFSIQLMSSETELRELMDELSSAELVPIKPPIILGHPCIASSALYGNLCRGVVVSVSHTAVKVYFVDFGNTEDLPASSIYHLPPKFFKIRVLSQKFSLSGLQKVAYSDDIRKFFKEVVQDELLMLRVTSLEDDNLPTCELYLKSVNIKRILNEKIREQRISVQDYVPKVGDTENVIVTWVVSPQKFFVQLQKRDADLKALKAELAEVETKGQRLTYQQLSVGFKCVCQFETDGNWYRAVITSVDSEDAITVFYVDYGNTETVNISLLRRVNSPGLINQMNNQAIQCSLKGFENKQFDQELANKLEALVLEKEVQMTVVSSEKELLCVQLLQNQQDISALLLNAPIKLDSFDTSPSTKDDVWDGTSGGLGVSNFEKEKITEKENPHENKDTRIYRVEKPRGEKSSRPFSHLKSPVHSTPIQLKKRFEGKENWREDKDKDNCWNGKTENQNTWKPSSYKTPSSYKSRDNDWDNNGSSKFNGNRGGKQGRDDWGDITKMEKSRTFKQDKTRDGWDKKKEFNFGERKKFDENRGFREGKRFERNRSQDSWKDEEPRSKSDRNDNTVSENGKPKSMKKPIRKDEAAPPGSKFADKVITIGSCESGIVTYYFSPDEFYVQLLAQEQEFTKMMKNIQKYYSDKYSIRDPLQAGDIVIAQFSLDKVLYRAEVVKPSPVTVCYVDYGNNEPVGLKSTWVVTKEFLKLPKQVLKCRLSNIRPVDLHWPPPGSAIDKFFALSEYKCTFLSEENGLYEIIMEDPDGKDIASEIIAAGLGRKMAPILDVAEIDFSLLPSQVLKLYVSHVESSSKFYVILNPKGLEEIENEIKTLKEDKKNLIKLNENLIKPETLCLTTTDEISWYRGKIVNTDGNKILIWFCDRGDSIEVTTDKLMILPDYLTAFQPQAIQCSLNENMVIEKEEEFKHIIEHKHNLISIVSAANKSLSVILYNEDGQKYDFQNGKDSPQTIEPISHLPIISQKLPAAISHFENPKEIYINRISDCDELNSFSELMSNFYSEEKDGFDIGEEEELEGMLVAAYSPAYESWYRARLVSSSEEGFEVFYIDYGNKEILPRDKVKKLDSSFINSHAFSRKFILNVEINPEKTEDVKNYLINSCNEKDILAYFKNDNGEFILDVVIDGERMSQLLKTSELALMDSSDRLANVFSEETTQPDIETSVSDLSGDLKVLISHIDSPNQFWVHKETVINDLHQFQDNLKQKCEVLPGKEIVEVGDIVAATYSDTWYRAKVLNIADKNIEVQFIDYGNTFNIDLTTDSVKELTAEFLNVPVFATQFALKGNWSENSTAKFEEIILQNEDFITAVVLEESEPAVVDLFQNGQSIAELLMEEGSVLGDGYESVFIAHFHSPDDFYVHKASSSDVYNNLSERLADASVFNNALNLEKGKMYVAKFPDDGEWYRARIVKVYGNEIEARFVDYGNTSNVTEVKVLPSDVIDIPPLAENCSLVYGDSNDSWSEAACEKFGELADGRELKMKVVAKKAGKSIVELYDGGKNVTKELEPLCENDERSEVYISYAVSPTDFYIQYVDDESYKSVLEKVNGEGDDLEEKTVGALCQACFVDDGLWYRAKIMQILDEGCEVFFIDFGNISISTEIKKLPPEIEDIPPRAFKSTLNLPETNIPESVKEEFINLAAGDATVYKANIIVPGNVNIISLKVNGILLEETLNSVINSEKGSFGFDGNTSDFSNSETDDGKNSKKNYEEYSNLSDEVKDSESITNETDEEKRVKFAQFEGSEGFKSDDEKGFVNATDNELMEEVRENNEHFFDVEDEDESGEVVEEEKNYVIQNGFGNSHDVENHKTSRNKVNKIVPGSISRGEKKIDETFTQTHTKLKYSEKLVPGSISRGISLESVANETLEEVLEIKVSKSAPNTPKFERRVSLQNYVKIDPNDRVVPGCISTGVLLHCSPSSEKIPKSDKILSGAVNGSSEDS